MGNIAVFKLRPTTFYFTNFYNSQINNSKHNRLTIDTRYKKISALAKAAKLACDRVSFVHD